MPYISARTVNEKRKAIKGALPEYTFSIRTRNHSTIAIRILSGPVSLSNMPCLKVLKTIRDIAASGMGQPYYDYDYGYVPEYYINIRVGQWDRPYVQTQK